MKKKSVNIVTCKTAVLIFFVLFLQAIFITNPASSLFKSYEEYKREIRWLGDSGQHTKAIELTKEMFTYYPEKRKMWLPILGGYYTELRDLKPAAEALEEYLESYPSDFNMKRILAMNYVEQGLYDKSIPLTEECLRNNPNDVVMRLEFSKALLAKGLYKESEKQCRVYIDSRPTDYKGWWMLGRIMSVKGNKFMATIYWMKVPRFKIRCLSFILISLVFCGIMIFYYWITGKKFKEKISEYKSNNIWRFGTWVLGLLFVSAAFYNFINPKVTYHWIEYPMWFDKSVFPIFLLAIGVGLILSLKWARIIAILFAASKVLEWLWNLSFSYGDISKINLSIAIILSWLIPMLYLGIPKVRKYFK